MFEELIISRANNAGIIINEEKARAFATYHDMLVTANSQFNLTRVPDTPEEAIDRNYLDCVVPLKTVDLRGKLVADVGSGAGFPGIPMSIMLPETRFVLIDSLGKRVNFLNDVIKALGLNAEAVHMRAEDAGRNKLYREKFDFTVARAVAGLNVLCEYMLPLTKVGGSLLALKGPNLDAEIVEAKNALIKLSGKVTDVFDTPIPERDWSHKAVVIKKTAKTSDVYPRKAGTAEKKPL